MAKTLLSLFLTILLVNFVIGKQIDFCSFGLSSNLDGRAYEITTFNSTHKDRAEEIEDAFEDMVKEDRVAAQFRRQFGEGIDTVTSFNWYYSFKSIGRINISDILPASLHCLYVYDREAFTEIYEQPTVTAESAVKFVLNEVIYQAIREAPTYVRLPLLQVSDRESVGCNFAKAVSSNEEYFLVQCMHDDWEGKALKSTKIIEKSTKKEICVSNMDGACDAEYEGLVDATITVDVTGEDELKKLISSMNCVNCTININVQSKTS